MDMTEILQHEPEFRYMLLSRLKADCNYFLGFGNRSAKYLWAETAQEHIECMKELWNSFSDDQKPDWLTMDDILDYEKKMLPEVTRLADLIQTAESKTVSQNFNAAKGAFTHEL